MRRRLLSGAVLVFLVATAGCSAFGPGPVDEDRLRENVSYDWDTEANATIEIQRDRFEAVYEIHNRSTFEAFRFTGFNDRGPVDPIGLRFRYANGTVANLTASAVTKHGDRTEIELPTSTGSLALSVEKNGKRVGIPILVAGTHEVSLPPGADAAYPILSHVTPGGYERFVQGDRAHFRWENPSGDGLTVRYYLHRDLLILGGLVAIASGALLVAGVHYWIRIRELEARREAVEADREDGGL